MTAPRLAVAVVLLVIASTVGVGATTAATGSAAATQETSNATQVAPMGANISMFMQANAAQAQGTVENGMWVAAYARTDNASERRALVERRVGSMNATLAELRAERRAIKDAYRNGTMDRVTYQARLSTVVGQLAALGEGIEETSERGRAVGVNRTRLDTLRTQARELGGGEVSRLARNLTEGRVPPGRAGVFGDGRPGPPTDRGPADAGNRSDGPSGPAGPSGSDDPSTDRGGDRGPPSDDPGRSDRGPADESTPTPTPTPAP